MLKAQIEPNQIQIKSNLPILIKAVIETSLITFHSIAKVIFKKMRSFIYRHQHPLITFEWQMQRKVNERREKWTELSTQVDFQD